MLAAVIVWFAYAIWLGKSIWGKGAKGFARINSMPANKRKLLAPICMIGGGAVLLLTFYLVWNAKLLSKPMPEYAYGIIAIILGGLVFIHLQTYAAAMIASIVVTTPSSPSSEQ